MSASVLTERKILVGPKASFEAYLMIRILNMVIKGNLRSSEGQVQVKLNK